MNFDRILEPRLPGSTARLSAAAALLAAAWVAGPRPAVAIGIVELDPALPAYESVAGVSGNLNSIGSDTLNNLLTPWSEAFRRVYPNVVVGIEGKGSSTAPPALTEGTAQIAPMSREMTAAEIDAFEQRHGYPPTLVPVAIDGLAVFVHKDNPLPGLTLAEVDAMFSSTRRRGGTPIETWGAVGPTGPAAAQAVSLYGRNSASGTYGFFKQVALLGGDYRSTVKEQPGSSAVVQGIATDPFGIGYSGIAYATSGVRILPIGETPGEYFEANYENCLSGDYPLARFLILYVNKAPNRPLDPLTLEFLKFVLSREGQSEVIKNGYYPLPAEVAGEIVESLSR